MADYPILMLRIIETGKVLCIYERKLRFLAANGSKQIEQMIQEGMRNYASGNFKISEIKIHKSESKFFQKYVDTTNGDLTNVDYYALTSIYLSPKRFMCNLQKLADTWNLQELKMILKKCKWYFDSLKNNKTPHDYLINHKTPMDDYSALSYALNRENVF